MTVSKLVAEIIRTGFMTQEQRKALNQLLEAGQFSSEEMPVVRRLIRTIVVGRVEFELVAQQRRAQMT